MASQMTQENRSLALTTPLGADVLKLVRFSGTEAVSQLFTYHFEMTSENVSIAPKDIVGKNVTWSVSRFDKEPRYFNGFVSRFSAGARDRRKLRTYHAEVVPWLWFLTRTANCRTFQNMGADAGSGGTPVTMPLKPTFKTVGTLRVSKGSASGAWKVRAGPSPTPPDAPSLRCLDSPSRAPWSPP